MIFKRISYRVRQFWNALYARPARSDLEVAFSILTPEQMTLFLQLQPSEQAHSLSVLKRLAQDKHTNLEDKNRDLMVAALLHDVGKTLHPIHVWERVLIVLSKALFPGRVRQWGSGEPAGWWRVFVIAERHPEWGARLAAQAGASRLAAELIRQHQNQNTDKSVDMFNGLLHRLQAADQDS